MPAQTMDPQGLSASPRYSHVAIANGFAYIAGQVALDVDGKLVGAGDFRAQAEQVYRNLRIAIEAVGATPRDIVKFTHFLLRREDLAGLVDIRRAILGEVRTASTAVIVSGLAREEFLLEIEAIVALPRG